jgi:hypothetical protein
MTRDRIIQLITVFALVICLGASGAVLPSLLRQADDNVLRYTNVSVEGAPPIVVLGQAIGALRGLIVDYYWIKANNMKEAGLYYEAMADADLICKLQPRFAQVWAFHGHNQTYNISVATHTQQERWTWVKAGINLVRNEGLRYNPNDMALHRELAFWLAHKIEGVSDDAHLFYKTEICREWHRVLGEPPMDLDMYLEWLGKVADAPEDLTGAISREPTVQTLLDRLRESYKKFDAGDLKLDREFLGRYSEWQAVKQSSEAAKILGMEQRLRQDSPLFVAFDEVAADASLVKAWDVLIAHVRKRVLRDDYNMEPERMLRYARELGVPIDWRHGSAHSLYWSRKGSEMGAGRVREYDIYIVLNNDSAQMQAMQDLARFGRISFDPFSPESQRPARFPEPRWIDTIDALFEPMYFKHYNVRGGGGERFINFLKNFLSSAICEWYRAGERQRALSLMHRLDRLFGSGPTGTEQFANPEERLDIFVKEQTYDQYQAQPHLAPRDIWASLTYGYKAATLFNRPEVLRDSVRFANEVTTWYKENHWNDFVNKFGVGRMKDIVFELEDSAEYSYLLLLSDPGVRMQDRMTIWGNTDRVEAEVNGRAPVLRAMVYDRVLPTLRQQFAQHELSQTMSVEQAFPAPPGLDNARQVILQRKQQREKEMQEVNQREQIERRS